MIQGYDAAHAAYKEQGMSLRQIELAEDEREEKCMEAGICKDCGVKPVQTGEPTGECDLCYKARCVECFEKLHQAPVGPVV